MIYLVHGLGPRGRGKRLPNLADGKTCIDFVQERHYVLCIPTVKYPDNSDYMVDKILAIESASALVEVSRHHILFKQYY